MPYFGVCMHKGFSVANQLRLGQGISSMPYGPPVYMAPFGGIFCTSATEWGVGVVPEHLLHSRGGGGESRGFRTRQEQRTPGLKCSPKRMASTDWSCLYRRLSDRHRTHRRNYEQKEARRIFGLC